MSANLRNICIIAHVDHGKTTLVDFLLKQAGTFQEHQAVDERVMDSMDLERERGITILAKNTSVVVGDTKINIIDTPGHADFGGEVERIMGMSQGAILLVDAAEGPLPQTRFVLEKAIKQGLKIILCINKVDRPEVREGDRINEVINGAFDLFCDLGATEEQSDFPIVYACGRQGWCTLNPAEIPSLLEGKKGDLKPLFDLVLDYVNPPAVEDAPFRMLISNLDYSEWVGQMGVGRVYSGSVKKGDRLISKTVDAAGKPLNKVFTVTKVLSFKGLRQVEVDILEAGDIGLLAGLDEIHIGDTIVANETQEALPRIIVESPTLGMIFSINTGPLAGQEGEAVQSRKLRDRLLRFCRYNVALRFEETQQPDQFRILGRGELQFAILIEQMRREGLEFMVGRPEVLFQKDEGGQLMEPVERLVLDLPEQFSGEVTEMLQTRKGIMSSYENIGHGRIRLKFEIPTRGILGINSRFKTATRGEGIMSSEFIGYVPFKGELVHRINGALISDRDGETIPYALEGIQERGQLFVDPGVKVYEGMIIGECAKDQDLNVNACREKKLTNHRASGSDGLVMLQGVRKMSLEQCIEWIEEDEWIEATPETIRLRKKILPANIRNMKR
jgi:GTP-binding protein